MDLRIEGDTVTFWLRVKPRSSREQLRLDSTGGLRLDLYAAPTEGQANKACIAFLARLLRLPQSSIEIVKGAKSGQKLIRISGGRDLAGRLANAVAEAQRVTSHSRPKGDAKEKRE